MGAVTGTVFKTLILINASLVIGLAHSWVVQSGEQPIGFGVDEGAIEGTVLPRPVGDEQEGSPEAGETLGFEVSVAQAERLFEAGASGDLFVAFLDAREPEEYEAGHVLGSYRMTSETLNDYGFDLPVLSLGAIVPGETVLVIYCGGGTCDASHNLAGYLQDYGFTQMHIMTEGYPAWEAAGLPTEAGPDPLGDTP